jgi:hypothetical protein
MERTLVGLALILLSAGTLFAAPDAIVFQGGDVRISGLGNGLVFPNGSIQTTAEVAGPQGPQGIQGQQGPPGPSINTAPIYIKYCSNSNDCFCKNTFDLLITGGASCPHVTCTTVKHVPQSIGPGGEIILAHDVFYDAIIHFTISTSLPVGANLYDLSGKPPYRWYALCYGEAPNVYDGLVANSCKTNKDVPVANDVFLNIYAAPEVITLLCVSTAGSLLTVQLGGSASGSVTSTSADINCGSGHSECSKNYDAGHTVTLTAIPDPGSTFSGWFGGGCSGTGSCVITMNTDVTVTAIFSVP